jgi:hypothetical protein
MMKTSAMPSTDRMATIHTARLAHDSCWLAVKTAALPAIYAMIKSKSYSNAASDPPKARRTTANPKEASRNQSGVLSFMPFRHQSTQVRSSNMILSHALNASDIMKEGPKNRASIIAKGSNGMNNNIAPKQNVGCRKAVHSKAAIPQTNAGMTSDTPNTLNKPASRRIEATQTITNADLYGFCTFAADCEATFMLVDLQTDAGF